MLPIQEQIKQTWWLFLGGAALNFVMIAAGWVKGPLKTWWTIGGIISVLIGGWGFMMANNMISSGYTYYHDGYYYFG